MNYGHSFSSSVACSSFRQVFVSWRTLSFTGMFALRPVVFEDAPFPVHLVDDRSAVATSFSFDTWSFCFVCLPLDGGPSMIADIVSYNTPVNPILYECATINFQLALLVDIIDLFLYNHGVRKYLTGLCLPRC